MLRHQGADRRAFRVIFGDRSVLACGTPIARASPVASPRIERFAPFLALGSLAAFVMGCQGARVDKSAEAAAAGWLELQSQDSSKGSRTQLTSAQLTRAQAAPAQAGPVQAAAPNAPVGEQTLDTSVGPQHPVAPPSNAPVLTTNHLKTSKVRSVSDEHLPKWVPVRGRLTVVDSSDLAENLGLVPNGATKKSDERISVAEKLQEESVARAAARAGDPMTQGSSWSYAKAGKFRSRR